MVSKIKNKTINKITICILSILILNTELAMGDTIKDISCTHCHSKEVTEFQKSVHYNKILCTNCHGGESDINGTVSIKAMDNITDIPTKTNIAEICSKCHIDVTASYKDSIHWKGITEGRTEAPSCLDCHGIHNILSYKDPNSMTYYEIVPETCANCHENQSKMGAWYYGISTDRFDTYKKSYHYKAIILKEEKQRLTNGKGYATCPDCHENHNTKNESDPTSAIYPANLPVTCGKSECHPNQNVVIYGGKVHEGQSVYLLSIDLKKFITYFYIAMILFEVSFTFGLIFLGIYSKIDIIRRGHNNKKENNHK